MPQGAEPEQVTPAAQTATPDPTSDPLADTQPVEVNRFAPTPDPRPDARWAWAQPQGAPQNAWYDPAPAEPQGGASAPWMPAGTAPALATPPPPHPATARVITGPFFRNERSPLAGLKTINYGDNVVALRLAREAGAEEALFANTRDELCEGTWSNVFVRIDGTWHTPPLSSGCLPGITRGVVIGLFEEHGLPLSEATLSYASLDRVESAFLTSSLREIQPVAAIDGKELEIAAETIVLQSSYRSLAS